MCCLRVVLIICVVIVCSRCVVSCVFFCWNRWFSFSVFWCGWGVCVLVIWLNWMCCWKICCCI